VRRADGVLHLHRLNDGQDLPGRDVFARGHRNPHHGPLHRGGDHVAGRVPGALPHARLLLGLRQGNSAKSWFRPSGRYPDTFVAREYGEFALRVVS
jgi:hypothetical protein